MIREYQTPFQATIEYETHQALGHIRDSPEKGHGLDRKAKDPQSSHQPQISQPQVKKQPQIKAQSQSKERHIRN
nr:hypothetical protein B0A51_16188 [Rachicladosporium sp. CCFEE 5018]